MSMSVEEKREDLYQPDPTDVANIDALVKYDESTPFDQRRCGGVTWSHTLASVSAYNKQKAMQPTKFMPVWATYCTVEGPKFSLNSQFGKLTAVLSYKAFPVGEIPTIRWRVIDEENPYKVFGYSEWQRQWLTAHDATMRDLYLELMDKLKQVIAEEQK
jgi:hypothetical protein